jgi:acyl-CoA reductase-like NAD-dependent aldehyde dehydrogenase
VPRQPQGLSQCDAQPGWAGANAYLRGQILYRIAEMLEGRREQFIAELKLQGVTQRAAQKEVNASIDRLIYFAGWADKFISRAGRTSTSRCSVR